MALTFPLDRDAFLGFLRVKSMTMTLPDRAEVSNLRDGSIIRDELGPRLWRGSIQVHQAPAALTRRFDALINSVNISGGSFLAYDVANPYPANDPDGMVLGSSTVQINSIAGDTTALSLKGLPVGYTLLMGDRLSFTYGSNPLRYAIHEVAEPSVVADATGVTPEFHVSPAVVPGAAEDMTVELFRPHCKAIIVPGSLRPGRSSLDKTAGASFEFIQTLR